MASNNWTPDQLANVLARGHHTAANQPGPAPAPPPEPARPNKMGNEPKVYNGQRYDSKAEAHYAQGLDFKVLAGLVLRWERQIVFSLDLNGVHLAKYKLDFRVHYADGRIEHIDVKGQRSGVPYDLFKLKKRLMLALFAIDVLEQK